MSAYYPFTPLKYSAEDFPKQPFKGEPDEPTYPADTMEAADSEPPESRSGIYLAPLRPQLYRKGPSAGRPTLWRVMRTPLVMALLPLAAISYLAFCYIIHGKVVPVSTYGLYAVTPQHLTTIKGVITSISIVVISIALYPIYDIVSNLKSEEFFRVLASHERGVPLETINHISTPSFGHVEAMLAVWRHGCSNYYVLGIVASLLVWITATLAPGALTVESVLADSELLAFAIGAVPLQSVLNGTNIFPATNAYSNSATAVSIAWIEMELGVQYSFGTMNVSEENYVAMIAPVPVNLSATTSARWLSDVIGINPTCSWASTNLTAPLQVPTNSSSFASLATAYLVDFDLDVQVTTIDLSLFNSAQAIVKDPTLYVTNHTTGALPTDGSTVFLLAQCQSGCPPGISVNFTLDLKGVNTTFTVDLIDQTWSMAILTCLPNIMVETREVRSEGHGILSVQPRPAGDQLIRQGNLDLLQTTALFSIATATLTQSGGNLPPNLEQYSPLGSQVQADVLFGNSQFDSLPGSDSPFGTSVTISPAPIEHVTDRYTQMVRSALKPYLAGYLGLAHVPGRISTSELVFAASMWNLALASAVFMILAAVLAFAHFRPGKGAKFTLINVAAAVHGSELPGQFAQMKAELAGGGAHGRAVDVEGPGEGDSEVDGSLAKHYLRRVVSDAQDDQQDIVDMLAERRIFMQRRMDGSPVLRIS